MKVIDAKKFNELLINLETKIKPEQKQLDADNLLSVYWSSVSVTLHVVRKAVEEASVDIGH